MQPHQFTHPEVKLVCVTTNNKAVYYANKELLKTEIQQDTAGRLLFIHGGKMYLLPYPFQSRLN